jgi:uncharacterized membrane protein YeaQ/YmgE (transglycosylase-associated protein family)
MMLTARANERRPRLRAGRALRAAVVLAVALLASLVLATHLTIPLIVAAIGASLLIWLYRLVRSRA